MDMKDCVDFATNYYINRGLKWELILKIDSLFYLALITYASKLENKCICYFNNNIFKSLPPFLSFLTGYLVDIIKERA